MARERRPDDLPWRDVLQVDPACKLFDRLPPAELRALGDDIRKNGLVERVKYIKRDECIVVVDGQNRLDAMELIGLPVIEKSQIVNWDDFQWCSSPEF
jgi:hypothetical protein